MMLRYLGVIFQQRDPKIQEGLFSMGKKRKKRQIYIHTNIFYQHRNLFIIVLSSVSSGKSARERSRLGQAIYQISMGNLKTGSLWAIRPDWEMQQSVNSFGSRKNGAWQFLLTVLECQTKSQIAFCRAAKRKCQSIPRAKVKSLVRNLHF